MEFSFFDFKSNIKNICHCTLESYLDSGTTRQL